MRIEITLRWHDDVVEVRRVDHVTRFTIGARASDDLFVPLGRGAAASHTLLARGADGRVWLWPLDGAPVPLERETLADEPFEVRVGAFTVAVRIARPERAVLVPLMLDTRFANISTVTAAGMMALVAVLVLTPQPVRAEMDLSSLTSLRAHVRTMRIALPTPPAPRPRVPAPAAEEGLPTRARRVPAPGADQARAAVDVQGLAALVGGLASPVEGASQAAWQRALATVAGPTLAAAADGGLAARDLGPGSGHAPVSIGGLGASIHAAALDDGAQPRGGDLCGPLGCRQDRDVTMTQGKPLLLCGRTEEVAGCDAGRDVIRRVVRDHQGALAACYERALQAEPGLAGRAVLSWTISGQGRVESARLEESQLPQAVNTCLLASIKTWTFPVLPAWKSTGVVVRYPFMFSAH